jgi:WD40 repeat protein
MEGLNTSVQLPLHYSCMQRTFQGHEGEITKIKFFPSGQVLLSTGLDLTARVWSVLDGSCPRVLNGHKRSMFNFLLHFAVVIKS